MPRDSKVYLEDILEAVRRIRSYTAGLSRPSFVNDKKTVDAVIRNLEVIGEAVKGLAPEFRNRHPAVEWQKMAGLRDVLIHAYFGVQSSPRWKRR